MKSLKQVSEVLGIKHKTLRKYVYQGYVKAEKFDRILVVSDDEFNRLVEKYKAKGKIPNET